jgi:16S rRNA (adenine1518-N6/adenine1519-N6)-dimethyltransferase
MQSLSQIRQMLDAAGLAPHRRFGQNFLVDQNLMAKLLELAEVGAGDVVLEVGPGTGSLTQELLERAGRVVAVEIDRGLARLLAEQFAGESRLTLITADALVGKHKIEPAVLEALGPRASLVANLPYNVATPLVAQCLLDSWAVLRGAASGGGGGLTRFDRLSFTVQDEVADRLVAGADSAAYGPVSVVVALLGNVRLGPLLPAEAFWPRPQVVSRMVRIDFDAARAAELADASVLTAAVATAFGQRRKQIGSVIRRKNAAFDGDAFAAALAVAGIDTRIRAEEVTPRQYLALANALAGGSRRS